MGQHTVDVNADSFDAEVLESDVPVIVDFWAKWCAPCRAVAPHLEKMGETYAGKLKVAKVDADTARAVAVKYKVSALPTFLLFANGKEIDRKIGAASPAALEEFVQGAL